MPRPIRWIRRDRLYLVTQRTFQARCFFIPGKELNALVVGCLAYAAEKFGVRLCFTNFPSNHYHHLVRTHGDDDDECAERMRAFLQLANSQVAKEVQKLCAKAGKPWTGGIFGNERATITEISDEFEAQVEKLRYLMSEGVKHGLCPDPCAWPGVQSASPWCAVPWILCDEATSVAQSSPMPYAGSWRKRLMDTTMPTYQPDGAKQGAVPQVHCATMDAWRCWIEEWEFYVNRYERASRRLRSGIREALDEFPSGCFVPSGIWLRRAGP